MIQTPALPIGDSSDGNGAGASGSRYRTVQLGGSIKKTGRLVPQRSILTPTRSAVLDKFIEDSLLFMDKVNRILIIQIKLTQSVYWHLHNGTLRESIKLGH
jgi:hypothetical protein